MNLGWLEEKIEAKFNYLVELTFPIRLKLTILETSYLNNGKN